MIKTKNISRVVFLISSLLFLCACRVAVETRPAYELAQGCYAIQSENKKRFMTVRDGSYEFANVGEREAAPIFLKPSELGMFLLFDNEGSFLSVENYRVTRVSEATDKSIWAISNIDLWNGSQKVGDSFAVRSRANKFYLTDTGDRPRLIFENRKQMTPKVALNFVPLSKQDCLEFKEAELNAEVIPDSMSPKDPSEPVSGYVDLHTHIGFPRALGHVAMSGEVFHPLGIEHALHQCSDIHGSKGQLDFLEIQNTGTGEHETEGFPDFTYWPNKKTNTHVQAYYRWLERAYLSGLRIVVTHVTGNPTYCQLLKLMHSGKSDVGCSAREAVKAQTDYIYNLQNYIDAQEGGPGKGWLRVVDSSRQAREVIAQNKLAVVLGIEHGDLFDCREAVGYCDKHYIEQQLDTIYKMGIRSVFPLHRFDNAYGGTKPGDPWMHLTSMISTSKIEHILDLVNPTKLLFKPMGGHFYEMEPCPDGIAGISNLASMDHFFENDFKILTGLLTKIPEVGPVLDNAFSSVFFKKIPTPPTYDEIRGIRACNVRGLQDKGVHLVNGLIDRGMIIEIDHMSHKTFMDTLSILEARNYSGFVSSHSWVDTNPEIRRRFFSLGGIIGPMYNNASNTARALVAQSTELSSFPFSTGVGIGSDIQGVKGHPNADAGIKLQYPFKSYDNSALFHRPVTGNRDFNYLTDGVAHYGLMAEWIENLRQVDPQGKAMSVLMRSAEAYLQMWERAESQRQ